MINFEKEVLRSLESVLGGTDISSIIIEAPKNEGHGDLAFPCFSLAKSQRKNPAQIAQELAQKIQPSGLVSRVEAAGAYLNFFIDTTQLAGNVLEDALNQKENYGTSDIGQGKLVIVEYSSPNLGKPMHVGHIRSTIIGDSLKRILEFCGYKTHSINYLGDTGLHMGKMIVAYNLWGGDKALSKDPEGGLLDMYVRYNKESSEDSSLEERAKEALRKLEDNDPEHLRILEQIKQISLAAFDRVYSTLAVSFDETTGQSHFSEAGKEQVRMALEKGIAKMAQLDITRPGFEAEEGELGGKCPVIDLTPHGLPSKVLQRADGTATYCTQDLGTATQRYKKHRFDKMIYVVGNPQTEYFKQLFKILELMGYEWVSQCYHLGFGLIKFQKTDGSVVKFSTREGDVIRLEEVLDRIISKAKEVCAVKGIASMDEGTSKKIGIGALKYFVLSIDPDRDRVFNWGQITDIEGNSAPYIQYSYARATRIIEKAAGLADKYDPSLLTHPLEAKLTKRMANFYKVVQNAARDFRTDYVTTYLADICGIFNQYYQEVRVLGTEQQNARLALIESFRTVVRNALGLIGIEAPEKM